MGSPTTGIPTLDRILAWPQPGQIEASPVDTLAPRGADPAMLGVSRYHWTRFVDEKAKARFWSKVVQSGGCLNWSGCISAIGYGSFKVGGKRGWAIPAHRVAYFIAYGVDPGEKHVMHSCDNRRCCNPAHLSLGDPKENMMDCAHKGRNRSPRPGNGVRKISDEQRVAITAMFDAGSNKSEIARHFGVTPARVRQILREEHAR